MSNEFKDVGGRKMDDYLGNDVIFQYLRERRNRVKRARVGVMIALCNSDNEVYIGFSKCNEKDKFNLLEGLRIAEYRARGRRGPNIPLKHMKEMVNFIKRSKRYFKGVKVFHYPVIEENVCTECNGDGVSRHICDGFGNGINDKDKLYTECHSDIRFDDKIKGRLSREKLGDIKGTPTELYELSYEVREKLAVDMAKRELKREKLSKGGFDSINKFKYDQHSDIAKVLDDSFRDKGLEKGVDFIVKPKIKLISYDKNYFTNGHIKDLNARIKELEDKIGKLEAIHKKGEDKEDKGEKVGDSKGEGNGTIYVIRHKYDDKYLVNNELYSNKLSEAKKYNSVSMAVQVIKDMGMVNFEEVVRVDRWNGGDKGELTFIRLSEDRD